jgi:hypothetical protein
VIRSVTSSDVNSNSGKLLEKDIYERYRNPRLVKDEDINKTATTEMESILHQFTED